MFHKIYHNFYINFHQIYEKKTYFVTKNHEQPSEIH